MNSWVKVARYLVVSPAFLYFPWLILGIDFVINLMIASGISSHGPYYTGALAAIYILTVILTGIMTYQNLPAALALGVSRRSLYAATTIALLAVAAANSLALTLLQAIERASGGFGTGLHFFRVPYLFAGPWYLTWLTSFVGLALMGAWGIWFSLVYRRWSMIGILGFSAAQALAVTLILVIAARVNAWHAIASFFTGLTIEGLTGLLAALTVGLLAGGFATIRRATV